MAEFKLQTDTAVVKNGKVVHYGPGKAPKTVEQTAVKQVEKTEKQQDAPRS